MIVRERKLNWMFEERERFAYTKNFNDDNDTIIIVQKHIEKHIDVNISK